MSLGSASGAVDKQAAQTRVALRCPDCGVMGTFNPIVGTDVRLNSGAVLGVRACPNPICLSAVFLFAYPGHAPKTYPSQQLEFNATDIPAQIVEALTEAIVCHSAECFVASAIMVRKALEELCRDQGATVGNLKQRIKALRSTVLLPPELLDGLDDLRLLGNDAAHVESRTFSQIGHEELEVCIDFAKEVLKAVYQYKALLGKVRNLQSAPEKADPT